LIVANLHRVFLFAAGVVAAGVTGMRLPYAKFLRDPGL
jgi:hypothetical protein